MFLCCLCRMRSTMGHACPVLCPARASLARISLGLCLWLPTSLDSWMWERSTSGGTTPGFSSVHAFEKPRRLHVEVEVVHRHMRVLWRHKIYRDCAWIVTDQLKSHQHLDKNLRAWPRASRHRCSERVRNNNRREFLVAWRT